MHNATLRLPVPHCLVLVLIALFGLSACTADPDAPEARVRAVLTQTEAAVEARDLGALKALFSDSYRDEGGRSKKQASDLAGIYFMRNRSIHLVTRVDSLSFDADSTEARASVLVAMAGRAMDKTDMRALARAAIYRFNVAVAYEGEDTWKITRARWQRAESKAFF